MPDYKVAINNEILNLVSEIDEFKGAWPLLKILPPERFASLKKSAIAASIAASTRIEGLRLNKNQIEDLISDINQVSFKDSDEEEIVGYYNALQFIFDSYEEIDLSENYIKQIHSILLKFNYKHFKRRGDYKKLDNYILVYDLNGKSFGVICKTAAPFETQAKMNDLVNWAKNSFEERETHPLITLSIFILIFLIIHPFQDANGRLSRCLINLVLLKLGYKFIEYGSFEEIIESNKELYYANLRECQDIIYNKNLNLQNWVLFFLRSLKKQKDIIEQRIKKEKNIQDNFSDLHLKILKILHANNKLSISDIQSISNANRNTLKVKLRELSSMKKIISIGKGRSARYSIAL